KIRPGLHKSFLVERHAVLEPAGIRVRSRHHENVANRHRREFARRVAPSHTLQALSPFERDDSGFCLELDVRCLLDPADQVARHRVGEARSSDEHVDTTLGLGKKYRRLTRGVCAPDHDDVFATAEDLLYRGGAVVDAYALEE